MLTLNWNRAYEASFRCGGFTFFPYQFALGGSVRYLCCLHSFMLRLYLGPFKVWVNVKC